MVRCPYCQVVVNREDQEAEKSILRIHIEAFHPKEGMQ